MLCEKWLYRIPVLLKQQKKEKKKKKKTNRQTSCVFETLLKRPFLKSVILVFDIDPDI